MRIAKNGMIGLDLNEPDEVCLLPEAWGGRYPKTSCGDRIKKLSEQQNHRCCYCGTRTWNKHYDETGPWQTAATVEHLRTRKKGGTFRKGNIVMACAQCNQQRDQTNPIIFLHQKQGRPEFELVPLEGDKT